ncbi:MAG: hypothetical protein JSV24_10800 [Bacteroidales bacterium]|nr:MAG: hypothetical protein JSV24_10800 [Bacteroidales bacterium]
MPVETKEVKTKKDLRRFIYLPATINKECSNWVPPIYQDEFLFFNPKKNRSFSYSDTILLFAYKNGKLAGRIMGLINKRYNEIHKEDHARFEFLDCYDDQEIVHSLVNRVENWAREKGMKKIVGPLGFSDKDPQGFLLEGFEHRAILATVWNQEYMNRLITAEGYQKKVDLNDYLIRIPEEIPEIYRRIYQRVSHKSNFRVIDFTRKKELKPYIIPVLRLMNECYSDIYGFVPLTDQEMVEYAARYLPVLDPNFVKVTVADGEVVGFVISMPDLSDGLQKAKGRLFPFGIFKILASIKKSKHLVLLLGAIKQKFHGSGMDVMMAVKLLETAASRNMESIESHLVLEHNHKMIGEITKIGGTIHKRFRIYEKAL